MARAWGYRLAEWRALPDDDRELLMAEDALVCPSCGNLRSECSDPDRDWHPNTTTCYASATVAWGRRVLAEKYEKQKPGTDMLHDLDGVSIWPSSVDLHDPEFEPPTGGSG